MFCKHCGNQMPDDAVFCAKCGTPVSDSARRVVNANAPSAPSSAMQQPPAPAKPAPSAQTVPTRPATQPTKPMATNGQAQRAVPSQGPAGAGASATQASPLRFVEGGLAVLLVILLFAVPFVEISIMGFKTSYSIPSIISIFSTFSEAAGQLGGMVGASQGVNEMNTYTIAIGAMLALTVLFGLITAFMTLVKGTRKMVPFAWGMLVCVGIFIGALYAAVNQMSGGASSSSFGMGAGGVSPSIGAWITLAGCLALGIIDVVRVKQQ